MSSGEISWEHRWNRKNVVYIFKDIVRQKNSSVLSTLLYVLAITHIFSLYFFLENNRAHTHAYAIISYDFSALLRKAEKKTESRRKELKFNTSLDIVLFNSRKKKFILCCLSVQFNFVQLIRLIIIDNFCSQTNIKRIASEFELQLRR